MKLNNESCISFLQGSGWMRNHDEKVKNARTYLTYAVGVVLKTGASLLGIKMPDKM